jgi:phage terminase large subunit-like protein
MPQSNNQAQMAQRKTKAQLLAEELVLREKQQELVEGLPHLYGWPWYSWAREYCESTNKTNLLVAANQISKSSTNIRKCIDWATDKKKWPLLWRARPTQFWYMYPSLEVASIEYRTKWVPEFLPRGRFKDHPVYGWTPELEKNSIKAIHFNSGLSVYFKSYSMSSTNLQTATVYANFSDEEMPEEIYGEVRARLNATDGYFHMVFTATIGQDFWRRAMEPGSKEEELFPEAWKRCVSLYDCLKYENGDDTPWTLERIARIEAQCATKNEILKRVYGRFVKSEGLLYPAFDVSVNMHKKEKIPKDWLIYTGVDPGSGGESGHPAAIVFVAVKPDFSFGRIFRGWRGDKIQTTTSDILAKHTEMKLMGRPGVPEDRILRPVGQFYDWQAKDFFVLASRAQESFQPADKNRERGVQLLNTLFKNKMLAIDENDPELQKLVIELCSLVGSTPKSHAKDDFIDGVRFATTNIPWDFSQIEGVMLERTAIVSDTRTENQKEVDERRAGFFGGNHDQDTWEADEELDGWNDLFDGA